MSYNTFQCDMFAQYIVPQTGFRDTDSRIQVSGLRLNQVALGDAGDLSLEEYTEEIVRLPLVKGPHPWEEARDPEALKMLDYSFEQSEIPFLKTPMILSRGDPGSGKSVQLEMFGFLAWQLYGVRFVKHSTDYCKLLIADRAGWLSGISHRGSKSDIPALRAKQKIQSLPSELVITLLSMLSVTDWLQGNGSLIDSTLRDGKYLQEVLTRVDSVLYHYSQGMLQNRYDVTHHLFYYTDSARMYMGQFPEVGEAMDFLMQEKLSSVVLPESYTKILELEEKINTLRYRVRKYPIVLEVTRSDQNAVEAMQARAQQADPISYMTTAEPEVRSRYRIGPELHVTYHYCYKNDGDLLDLFIQTASGIGVKDLRRNDATPLFNKFITLSEKRKSQVYDAMSFPYWFRNHSTKLTS